MVRLYPFFNVALQGISNDLKDTLDRTLEHLKDNSVDLASIKVRVGAALTIDPKMEAFVGSSQQASAMLTREYRKPFGVPSSAANV